MLISDLKICWWSFWYHLQIYSVQPPYHVVLTPIHFPFQLHPKTQVYLNILSISRLYILFNYRGRRNPMVVWFTITYAISTYQHWSCDNVCQWLTTGRWFSPGTPASATNKTDSHDITEILLKVAWNTINHKPSIVFTLHLESSVKWEFKHYNIMEQLSQCLLLKINGEERF